MASITLRVRLRDRSPDAPPCVQNHERLDAGVNQFVGLRLAEVTPGTFGRVPTNEVEELPFRAEYVKALKDGDLLPADEATAKAAGLEFTSPTMRAQARPTTFDAKDGDR